MIRYAVILTALALVGCTQPPAAAPARVQCATLPDLPKTPTYASQALLISMYSACATLKAQP